MLVLALETAVWTQEQKCALICVNSSCVDRASRMAPLSTDQNRCATWQTYIKCLNRKDKACFPINVINLPWIWRAVLTLWDHLSFAVREKILWLSKLPFYISARPKYSELFSRTNPAPISKLPASPSTSSLLFLH